MMHQQWQLRWETAPRSPLRWSEGWDIEQCMSRSSMGWVWSILSSSSRVHRFANGRYMGALHITQGERVRACCDKGYCAAKKQTAGGEATTRPVGGEGDERQRQRWEAERDNSVTAATGRRAVSVCAYVFALA
eukprot:GHVU01033573.1.p2 GENE.GHVU01033573.1~~GHVU01033573.1.p2  ORF type:complete len:133 (-),score=16.18 GHVU01033573.1:650-1048(-)